jgi:hypothetical protein
MVCIRIDRRATQSPFESMLNDFNIDLSYYGWWEGLPSDLSSDLPSDL